MFKEETHPAAESLVQAGRCILLAAHKLQVQPDKPGHREELAASAKRVFTETAKVMAEGDSAAMSRERGQAGMQRWVKSAAVEGTRAAPQQDMRWGLGEALDGAMVVSSPGTQLGQVCWAKHTSALPYKGWGVSLAAQRKKQRTGILQP